MHESNSLLKLSLAICLSASLSTSATAQDRNAKDKNDAGLPALGTPLENGVTFGVGSKQRWQAGVIIKATGAPCVGVLATVPVPTDWPEQEVRIVAEDITPQVTKVDYRTLDNGVKQLLISIPQLNPNETAKCLITFEVTKKPILAPADPTLFVMPEKTTRKMASYLGTSPFIESTNVKIKTLAREVTKDKEDAWGKVEAIYDYVRANVEYKEGPLKGALAALKDGNGDCEELTSLFVAMCRASRIPSRTVWVPGHCYPEFYLEDADGTGHWIPCQAAGDREFGSMPDTRPILQKGDNFRVPEKKEPQRYVAELLSAKSIRGNGKPEVQFVRELLPME